MAWALVNAKNSTWMHQLARLCAHSSRSLYQNHSLITLFVWKELEELLEGIGQELLFLFTAGGVPLTLVFDGIARTIYPSRNLYVYRDIEGLLPRLSCPRGCLEAKLKLNWKELPTQTTKNICWVLKLLDLKDVMLLEEIKNVIWQEMI